MRVICLDEGLRQSTLLPPGFRWSTAEVLVESEVLPGAAVVRDAADLERLKAVLTPVCAATLPLIGLNDSLQPLVDQVISPAVPTIAAALMAMRPTIERARKLPPVLMEVQDPATHLLAYLAVRDATLDPVYDVGCPQIGRLAASDRLGASVAQAAEQLVAWRYLTSAFCTYLNVCPSCASARLLVREECPACRSTNIADESIIHHFRCATEAPESHFRQGWDLVCPKCRHYLTHFSVDYDKPGLTIVCRACGHQTGEPAIGFQCLDCKLHDDAGRLMRREVKSYRLTGAGRAAVFDPVTLARLAAVAEQPAACAAMPEAPGDEVLAPSGCTLVEVRFPPSGRSPWRFPGLASTSPADKRSRELVRRLVQEHFGIDVRRIAEADRGFEIVVDRGADDVRIELPAIEQKLKVLVANPVAFDLTVKPMREPPGVVAAAARANFARVESESALSL
ncbi:MAG: hypothetical protein R3D62_11095 [Xanthobacteraceae bacterium]